MNNKSMKKKCLKNYYHYCYNVKFFKIDNNKK
jgi:hypothetical protein